MNHVHRNRPPMNRNNLFGDSHMLVVLVVGVLTAIVAMAIFAGVAQ